MLNSWQNVATYLCIILLSSGYFLYFNNISFIFIIAEEVWVYPVGQLIRIVSFYCKWCECVCVYLCMSVYTQHTHAMMYMIMARVQNESFSLSSKKVLGVESGHHVYTTSFDLLSHFTDPS